jgi:hypothetical protein
MHILIYGARLAVPAIPSRARVWPHRGDLTGMFR